MTEILPWPGKHHDERSASMALRRAHHSTGNLFGELNGVILDYSPGLRHPSNRRLKEATSHRLQGSHS
jgi:hypothetical protein